MIDLSRKFAHYSARLIEAQDQRRISNEDLAERLDAHPVTVSKLRKNKIRLDDEWRARIAVALDIPVDELFGEGPLPRPLPHQIRPSRRRGATPVNDNLPHFGLAAGSVIGAAALSNDLPDEVPCPPGLREAIGAYALTTRGESMIPRFFPGERLYVNPNQKVRPGDHVVIQTTNDDGTTMETWVKRYDTEDAATIWVTQYNPNSRIAFPKRYVRYVHRIMLVNELF